MAPIIRVALQLLVVVLIVRLIFEHLALVFIFVVLYAAFVALRHRY